MSFQADCYIRPLLCACGSDFLCWFGCNCSFLKWLTLFFHWLTHAATPQGEDVSHLLVQRRMLLFLPGSSGWKGLEKVGENGEAIFRCEFILKALFRACYHPFTLVVFFFFLVSPVSGKLQQQIENANRLQDQILYPGGGFEGRIRALSFHFCFVKTEWLQRKHVVWNWCKGVQDALFAVTAAGRRSGTGLFLFCHICLLCTTSVFCFLFVFSCRPWQRLWLMLEQNCGVINETLCGRESADLSAFLNVQDFPLYV